MQLGQTKVRGDWAVYALYEYLEQDAVISAFTLERLRRRRDEPEGPGGRLQLPAAQPAHREREAYFTNFIDQPWTASQGTSRWVNNPTQTRFQLDAVVEF